MTTNLLRGKSRVATNPKAKGFAIGEPNAHVFDCPSCARPLAEGTSRCPGCGVRLIMGVRVKRAGGILALGVVLGVFGGGVATASVITLSIHRPVPAIAEEPPPASVPAHAAPSAPAAIVQLAAPAAAVSALSGTAVVNGRIAVDAATLDATLSRPGAPTIEIARALRSLAADATLGVDLTGRLSPWTEGAAVKSKLDDFYMTMATTAQVAFRASLTDEAAYRKAGAAMMTVLAQLGGVDASSRSLAATVDLELPPVVVPGAQGSAAPAASTSP